jgi:hypothetical protein
MLSVLTLWFKLGGPWGAKPAAPCMTLLLLLLWLLVLHLASAWLHAVDNTDPALPPAMHAGDPGTPEGMKAGICGLSGELVLLLLLGWSLASGPCINLPGGFPPTLTASRGVVPGGCTDAIVLVLHTDAAVSTACCCVRGCALVFALLLLLLLGL